MIECWAGRSDFCRKYPNCDTFCEIRVILEGIYAQSNIPLKYQFYQKLIPDPEDRPNYVIVREIVDKVDNWVKTGNHLLLWGTNKGNGKTSIACAIAGAYIRKNAYLSNLDPIVYFIKTSKFLEELRNQMDNPTKDFPHKLKLIEKVPLLIIDDIGAEKPTDWVRERLLDLIDERYGNNRSTIYTSNCSLGTISLNLHDRIADRISSCQSLNFLGHSKRRYNNGN